MKNFLYNIFCISLISLLCVSCTNSQDLGNGYIIQDSVESHVYITRSRNRSTQIVVDQHVVAWRRAGPYIMILRKVADSNDCDLGNGKMTIITHYSSIEEYWIINPKLDQIIGPVGKDEFNRQTSKLGFPNVELQVPQNYRDNTREYEKAALRCNQKN